MNSSDAYIDTIERMERDLAAVDLAPASASIAISLKRLADAAETIAKGILPPVFCADTPLTPEDVEAIRKSGPVLTEAHPLLPYNRGEKVRLHEMGPGLFLYEGELCVKTQYSTLCTTRTGARKPDCYIVATGEYFCGGHGVREEDIQNLTVTPISAMY